MYLSSLPPPNELRRGGTQMPALIREKMPIGLTESQSIFESGCVQGEGSMTLPKNFDQVSLNSIC